jgi:tRNA U55 pseudouridine synthase TruB
MAPKKQNRKKRTLDDEIVDAERKDPQESVSLSISVTRGLYLRALRAMRDEDYGSLSAYISDLIRHQTRVAVENERAIDEEKIKRNADRLLSGHSLTEADWK